MKQDTIAAVATPAGTGGVAVIRISGPDALSVLKRVFSYSGEYEHAKMVYGSVRDVGELIDRGLAVVFFAPKSYTGEETAELHCHGSVVGAARVLELICKNGARPALPGEFTKRAFMNGKMDLTQAEAVCDYISSVCAAGAKASMRQMEGGLKEAMLACQDILTDVIAEIEAAVEYPEEDLELEIADNAIPVLEELAQKISDLSGSFSRGRILKEGLDVAIVGKPNVGKSSLLNALVGMDRAIVADVPGTTRDTIEQSFLIGEIAINLTDTAGIRRTNDMVEAKGVERSVTAINSSKLVLFVADSTQKIAVEDHYIYNQLKDSQADVLFVLNKLDACESLLETALDAAFCRQDWVRVSAKTGAGIGELKNRIYEIAAVRDTQENVVITSMRHRQLLLAVTGHIGDALFALQNGIDMDCVTIDLNAAWKALGEITGNTVGEEIIDRIFSKFCLGK